MSNSIPGPEVGYIDLLDYHQVMKLEDEASKPIGYIPLRPSAAGYCTKRLGYAFNEYRGNAKYDQEVRTPAVHRLLNLGHSIEYNIVRQLEELDIFQVKYKQQVVDFDFKISKTEILEGSNDLCFWSDKWRSVVDIKSKKDKFTGYGKTAWDEDNYKYSQMNTVQVLGPSSFYIDDLPAFLEELNDPFTSDNFYQLNLYIHSKFFQDRGVDHGVLIYYNKNDSRLRELRFKPSVALFEKVKDKFASIADAIDNHKDPELLPRDYHLGSIRCAFCPYAKECRPGTDALKEYFSTWPKKNWPVKTSELSDPDEIELVYNNYKEADKGAKRKEVLEQVMIQYMEDNEIQKIQFSDKQVYELRALKSPRPHLALRRSKV